MGFIKIEKPKQFNYIPRFYDAAKEDLEERIKRIEGEVNKKDSDEYIPNLKGQFRKKHEELNGPGLKPKGRTVSRWLVLVIYAALVVAIIFLVLNMLTYIS